MTTNSLSADRRFRSRKTGLSIFIFIVASIIALIPGVPVIWVIFTALKERGRVIANPLAPPTEAHWENFINAWTVGRFSGYFMNSIVVSVLTVIIILIFGMLAAYAFAKMNFRAKDLLFIFFMVGLAIPMSVLIIPLFYEVRALNMLNTPWALVLPQVAKQLPFAILLLYSFIKDLPGDILDAGLIDGCNRWQLLRFIVAPLSMPAMLTLVIFTFMWSWNNFLLPIVLIHQDSARTLPVGLNHFQGRFVTDLPMLMAGATITFLPIVLVYVIFQRHFIRGISAGALK